MIKTIQPFHPMTIGVRRMLATIIAITCLISAAMQPARAEITDADRATLDAMIEDYITANPEVVRDALMALAKREADERLEAALRILFEDSGDPVLGNPDGSLVIYEFSDYNCGYCKRVFTPLQQLIAEDDDIKLVIKEFPILSQTSMLAAQAGIAAHQQGVFNEYHAAMMTSRSAVSMESILAAAEEAGADLEVLQAAMNSAEVNNVINRTRAAADRLEVSGTPAFVIGTQLVPGAIDLAQMRSIVAEERAKTN